MVSYTARLLRNELKAALEVSCVEDSDNPAIKPGAKNPGNMLAQGIASEEEIRPGSIEFF